MHTIHQHHELRFEKQGFVERRQSCRQLLSRWQVGSTPRHDTSAQQGNAPSDLNKSTEGASKKGFGTSKSRLPATSGQVLQKQLKSKQRVSKPGGQIDVVQVQDWGTGDPQQLGDLKIQTVERLYGDTKKAQSQLQKPSSDSAAHTVEEAAMGADHKSVETKDGSNSKHASIGFYQTLCQEMAMAEKRGAMAVAGPPPPPFQQWSFTPARYLQYLTDCLEVHKALEAALAASATDKFSMTDRHSQQSDAAVVQGSCSVLQSAIQQLSHSGLGRAAALQHDITILSTLHPQSVPKTPGQMARSHADRIHKLGRDVQLLILQHAEVPSSQDETQSIDSSHDRGSVTWHVVNGSHSEQEEVIQTGSRALASLLAHAFAIYTLHAAGDMRFGAVAAEKLNLLQSDAAHFYHSYAASVQEPLRTLQGILNEAGEKMDKSHREAMMAQIPDAVRSASMLLSALAHAD